MLELENRLLIMVTVHFTGGRAEAPSGTPKPSSECTRVWMKPADSSRRLWCGTTRFTVDVICTKIKHLSGSLSAIDTLCRRYMQLATGVRPSAAARRRLRKFPFGLWEQPSGHLSEETSHTLRRNFGFKRLQRYVTLTSTRLTFVLLRSDRRRGRDALALRSDYDSAAVPSFWFSTGSPGGRPGRSSSDTRQRSL